MGIGLGSLVESPAGVVMVVAATDGDEMFCVSADRQIKQWCHRSHLRNPVRHEPARQGALAIGVR